MKILITGGSGFIGTHLIQSFLNGNPCAHILNIDLKSSDLSDERINTYFSDIRSEGLINKIEDKIDFDYCIHLAALCKEPGYHWEEYFETNHIGTINTIRLCEQLGIENIIFTSTMMVYKAGEIQQTEGSITTPDTAYGISKLLAEKELEAWRGRKSGRSLKIIRPAVVFGENENGNFTRLYHTLKRGFFPYIGKRSTVKSNIYVKELVMFIEYLLEHKTKSDIFNFSFPEKYSMERIVGDFKSIFG
ncbi:MAG: NAD(P)-dependent oxidoreductase, partial [Fulvivirga sp.]|uniref:NAD-dependent epimerase/dehydratase family protein n=1 Tax=Fulvivirga sp. TaxID=1931237 RepID=UPI0032EFB514